MLRALHGKELHGYAIQRELTSAGFNVEVGNLYRVLRSMEGQAQVRSRWSESHRGPKKRVYAVGPEGRRQREVMLREAIFTILQEYADYLTAHVAPHAVRDSKQIAALEGEVLVGVPHPADVGGRSGAEHRHLVTSKTVAPICRRSPRASLVGFAIRSELTYVPLVDPRSSTISWSPRR